MKSGRRLHREHALQVLYLMDLNKNLSPRDALRIYEQNQSIIVDEFTFDLVVGIADKQGEIDPLIEKYSLHWKKDRMPVVDRNILRLGVYELLFRDDIPATVTINEMVEIAKEYGSEHSSSFTNGVLDQVKAHLDRPNKVP